MPHKDKPPLLLFHLGCDFAPDRLFQLSYSSEGRANPELDKRVTGPWVKHIGYEPIPFVIDSQKEACLMLQWPLKKHGVTLPGISKTKPLEGLIGNLIPHIIKISRWRRSVEDVLVADKSI